MRFGRCSATDNAGLGGDEFAMQFVAQANGLRRNRTSAYGRSARKDHRGCGCVSHRRKERLLVRTSETCFSTDCDCSLGSGRQLDRREQLAEADLDEVCVGGGEGVLQGQVLVLPVGGLFRRLELANVGEQPLPTAADCSGPRIVRAGRTAFSFRAKAVVAAFGDAADTADGSGRVSFRAFGGWVSAPIAGADVVGGEFPIEIRRVEIVLARDSDQGEKGIASRVGECRPHSTRGGPR